MAQKRGIEFYKDAKGEWRWRVWSKNGRKLANSGEGYARKDACVRGARAAKRELFDSLPVV